MKAEISSQAIGATDKRNRIEKLWDSKIIYNPKLGQKIQNSKNTVN